MILHSGYDVDTKKCKGDIQSIYYQAGNSLQEYEANEFAAAFLMPKTEFVSVVERLRCGDSINLRTLADSFDVSEDAVINRGRFLGIFSW